MSTLQVDLIGLYDPISDRFLPPDNKRFDTVETVVSAGLGPLRRSRMLQLTLENWMNSSIFEVLTSGHP
jgi:hypothetical protein